MRIEDAVKRLNHEDPAVRDEATRTVLGARHGAVSFLVNELALPGAPVAKIGLFLAALKAREGLPAFYALLQRGVLDVDERAVVARALGELFDLLVTVSGIGPKVALSFLSVLSPDAFRRAVSSGDIGALTVVPGVGKKVAQRVVLDLKDKLGAEDLVIIDGPLADVREALLGLGLSQQEASDAMNDLAPNRDAPVEDLLRAALQHLGRGVG